MGAPSVPPGRDFRIWATSRADGAGERCARIPCRCGSSCDWGAVSGLQPDHSLVCQAVARLPHEVHAAASSTGFWRLMARRSGEGRAHRGGLFDDMEFNQALPTGDAPRVKARRELEHLATGELETPTAEPLASDGKPRHQEARERGCVSNERPRAKIAKMKSPAHLATSPMGHARRSGHHAVSGRRRPGRSDTTAVAGSRSSVHAA